MLPVIRQAWAVFGVLLNFVGAGMIMSYPSSLLPQLKIGDSQDLVDSHTASWIGSCICISTAAGILLSSYLMDRYGRKPALLLLLAPSIIGWLVIYLSNDIPTLIIGRVLTGFSNGATIICFKLILEYCSREDKIFYCNLEFISFTLGCLLIHAIGDYLHWKTITLIGIAPLILSAFIIMTCPETPAWLAMNNYLKESENAFYWFRSKNDMTLKEYEVFMQNYQNGSVKIVNNSHVCDKVLDFLWKINAKTFRKPLLIIAITALIVEASGRFIFAAYASSIISHIGFIEHNNLYIAVIDIALIVSSIISILIFKSFKRKTIISASTLILSAILITLSILGLYTLLFSTTDMLFSQMWVSFATIIVFFILSNLCFISLPKILIEELFAYSSVDTALCFSTLISTSLSFVYLKSFPIILEIIEFHTVFLVSTLIITVCLGFLYLTLPECKDTAIEDIEDHFNYGIIFDDAETRRDFIKSSTNIAYDNVRSDMQLLHLRTDYVPIVF